MKLTYIATICATILLTSCNDQTQIVSSYKYMVVHPSEAMYTCPVLKEFPKWQTLTDSQVAKTVLTLHKNNITCKSSLESIRAFLDKEEKRLQ
jgi:hypothetical protein